MNNYHLDDIVLHIVVFVIPVILLLRMPFMSIDHYAGRPMMINFVDMLNIHIVMMAFYSVDSFSYLKSKLKVADSSI